MRFVLEVDLDAGAMGRREPGGGDGAGAMKQVELAPGTRQEISDSDYTSVGEWRVEA